MATYVFRLNEAAAIRDLPGDSGMMITWNFVALATARSITFLANDTLEIGPIDVKEAFPGALEELVWMKRTDTSNADVVKIDGAITSAGFGANQYLTLPTHKFAATGANSAYSNAASSSVNVRATPAPWVKPVLQLITSVPATIVGSLWVLYRRR